MLFWKTLDIEDTQRALLYQRGQFVRVLGPGRHRINRLKGRLRVEFYDVSRVTFQNEKAKFLMKVYKDNLDEHIEQFVIADTEVGLLYRDQNLVEVLAPGSEFYVWKGVEDVRVDRLDISEHFQIEKKLVNLLGRGRAMATSKEVVNAIYYCEVADEHTGLLLVNGKLQELLQPGAYGFWKYNRSVLVKQLDLRLQNLEVGGQEILTRDRVSLRINLTASFRITDAQTLALKLRDYNTFVYSELQLRLREAVGTKSLDELLEDKDLVNTVIEDGLREKFSSYGIQLQGVGIKDIILPGDMKEILNKVVEAQKEAEANLIRRREETQAMRSLHNTAKMMENNAVLMRLKELEALERVTQRITNLSVYGGLDGVMNELVKLRN